jgi:hypothetical protein
MYSNVCGSQRVRGHNKRVKIENEYEKFVCTINVIYDWKFGNHLNKCYVS